MRINLRSITRIFRIKVSMSGGKQGVREGQEIDFTSLFVSLGLILIVLGGMEVIGIPIIHVTSGIRYDSFKVGSPIIPHLIGITTVPLVIGETGRRKTLLAVTIIGMIFLTDLTAGYSYSLPLSILLWMTILLLRRNMLQSNRILPYSITLATVYVCLVGFYVLISPMIPIEPPFLGKFTEVLWKVYSTLRWPAILLYTFLPYTLFIPFLFDFIRGRKQARSPDPEGIFCRELFPEKAFRSILIASMGLAAYLAIYNYMPKINPDSYPSGVDTTFYYYPSLRSMLNSNDPITFAFSEPFASTRPLYMLFLYSIHVVTGLNALQTAESAPAILLPLFTASYYLLASRLFNLKSMGALAAILTLAGIQTSVGIFTSYQANFLGLTIANLLTVLALTADSRRIAYPMICLLSFCLMLVHSWTSLYYVAIISIVLTYRVIRKRSAESLVRMIMSMLFSLLSVPLVNMVQQPVEGSTDPLRVAQATLIPMFSFENLYEYWLNMRLLFTEWFRGFMANAFLYFLAIVGIMRIRSMPEPTKVFLTAFLLILIPLPLVNYVLGSRLYFNVPLQLYASMAIYPLLQDNDHKKRLVSVLLSCLALVYSILAVANTGFFPVET